MIGDDARQGLTVGVELEAVAVAADQQVKVIWVKRANQFIFETLYISLYIFNHLPPSSRFYYLGLYNIVTKSLTPFTPKALTSFMDDL